MSSLTHIQWESLLLVAASVLVAVVLLNIVAFWGCDWVKRGGLKSWRCLRDHTSSQIPRISTAVKFIKRRSEGVEGGGGRGEDEETVLLLNDEGEVGRQRESDGEEVVLFVPVVSVLGPYP